MFRRTSKTGRRGIRAALVTATALVSTATVAVGVSAATSDGDAKTSSNPAKTSVKPAKPAKPAELQIAALFDDWNEALRSGDPDTVAARYAKDAVLLPTASPTIRTDRAGIVDYFEHFLKNKPKGEKVRSVINVLDKDSAIDAGLYDFHLTDAKTGEQSTVRARYTYEYEKRNGTWLIVNHHSSVLPPAS
ncbi:SgcJ/EcaC family oxidoreductase [Streptomyces sp. NPDC051776]|uniref:SgcJ/EcaC family oxidoreductase n=1 Tax=Streptomyces sp. NPDC051776 TaxID=3155414 RepID=UPI0034137F82